MISDISIYIYILKPVSGLWNVSGKSLLEISWQDWSLMDHFGIKKVQEKVQKIQGAFRIDIKKETDGRIWYRAESFVKNTA